MLYFGTTNIPGLYNVCDTSGCVIKELYRGGAVEQPEPTEPPPPR